jgi:hypothetical protein
MIKVLTDLPEGVIGFETSGELHDDDYRDVLMPAVEQAVAAGPLRVVLVIPAWEGMSGGALGQDVKMGVEHLRHWKRLALVTDLGWMEHATALFGWMSPGEMKTFGLAQRADAIAWAAA